MERLTEIWQEATTMEQVLWVMALVGSIFFLIQLVLTFFGGDSDMDGDADADVSADDGAGHQMFTLKNLVTFFTLFGWTSLACLSVGLSPLLSIVLGAAAGTLMVVLMMYLFSRLTALKHSGTLQLKNAIGLTGRAYLPIPALRAGLGKVHVRVQGGLKELDAIQAGPEIIPTGAIVHVVDIIDERILLVSTEPVK